MKVSKVKIAVIDAPINSDKKDYQKEKSFWHVDKDTLPYKVHFFLLNGALGAFLPYQTVIGMKRLGLTAGNLGAALTAQQLILILTNPYIGYLVDKFNKLKVFIVGLTILQAISCFFMIIIPSVDMPTFSQDKSNSSLNDTLMFNLCNILQDYNIISTLHHSSDYEMRKVLSHFEKSNGSVIKCSKWDDLEIIHLCNLNKICDIPTPQDMDSAFFLDLYNESFSNIIFITVLVNDSQNYRTVMCVSTEQFSILKSIASYNLIKKYCRSTSDSETLNLQKDLDISKFKIAKCRNSSIDPSSEDNFSLTTTSSNFKTYRFWMFTLCFLSSSLCVFSLMTLSDTACYESVQEVNYGRQALWGAISFGLIAPFAGFLNDYTEGYMASWSLLAIFGCLQIWNLSKMHLVKPHSPDKILKDIKTVFKSPEFLAFEIGVFMNGFFTAMTLTFMSWFITIIGGNKLVLGLVQTAECFLGEVPIMFISKWMIKTFGHFNLVSLALLCQGIRFSFYSFIHNPWWIIPVECLHGFTYGSFITSMTAYAKLNAKPGTETTTQAILFITYKAFGSGLGCIFAGYFFDHYGAHRTFFYTSFLCVLATFINVAFSLFFRSRKKVYNVTQDVNNKSKF